MHRETGCLAIVEKTLMLLGSHTNRYITVVIIITLYLMPSAYETAHVPGYVTMQVRPAYLLFKPTFRRHLTE